MPKRDSLHNRIQARIDRSRDNLFPLREFARMGGEDQVLRALRELVRAGRLVLAVLDRSGASRLRWPFG